VGADQFAEDCREARESPAKENSFRRYRLNRWTEQEVRWLSMEKWDTCAAGTPDLDGMVCFGGLDLSSTIDVSALVLVFPDDDLPAGQAGVHYVLPFLWVPEEGARQRERRDRVPYVEWIRDGLIEATPGEVIDYDRIRRRVNELGERYDIRLAILPIRRLARELSDQRERTNGERAEARLWPRPLAAPRDRHRPLERHAVGHAVD